MKTAVGLIATMIITAVGASGASAEWRLYVNRDNRAWSLERSYASNGECDRAARTLYRSGQALGVGCAEYPAPSSAQAPTPRPAEYSRPTTIEREVARADEMRRTSASRAPRVTEYAARRARRPAPVAESHPAAVIFPPSGGVEIQQEPPRPAVAAPPSPRPRRQAAPAVAQDNLVAQSSTEEDKNSAAVMLARAATEASATSTREAGAETVKPDWTVGADRGEWRTTLAVFGGVMLLVMTGVAFSVYRVSRASPLRALAVCLIEIGALTAALAYPVVAMLTRLKISESGGLSGIPGLLAGIMIAGVGVIVLALELTRTPARSKASGAPARGGDRKPQAPVALIKPGEYIKTGEPGKPVEPVRPLQPVTPPESVRPLEPVTPPDAARPAEPAKPVDGSKPVHPAKRLELVTYLEAVKQVEPSNPSGR